MRAPAIWFSFLIAPLISCASVLPADIAPLPSIPADWALVEGDGFRMWAPPSTRHEIPANYHGEFDAFVGFGAELIAVMGPQGITYDDVEDAEHFAVDGKDASFVFYIAHPDEDCEGYVVGASYRGFGNHIAGANSSGLENRVVTSEGAASPVMSVDLGEITLWMRGCSDDPEMIAVMGRMIRSVEFPPYD